MKATRIIALLLAVLTVSVMFVGCGDAENPETTTAAAEVTSAVPGTEEETTESIYDENGYIKDKLPTDLTFNDATVRTLYWNDVENQEFFAEEETGAAVNDAIWKRNNTVEERLKVNLEYVGVAGNWSNYMTYVNTLKNSINGGESDVYDIAASYSLTAGVCAYQGLVKTLNNLNYFDFTAEWWPSTLLDTATINGKLYFASGDISTNLLYMMYAVYYNKDMIDNYKLDDPFSFVESGKWTLDKMIELSSNIYEDTDKDGVRSAGDTYGQAYYYLHMDAYLFGSGIITMQEGTDGKLALTETYESTKMSDLIQKMCDYFATPGCYNYTDGTYKTNFAAGMSLFITDRADVAVMDLDAKDFTMGILPIPKYDENQEDYLNAVGNPFTLYEIPANASNPDTSAAVMECMASESYRTVTPAIFELSMKTRYSDGGNDVISYDLLRSGVVYDLGRLFGRVFDGAGVTSPGTLYQNCIKNSSMSFSTTLKQVKKAMNKLIDKLNDAFAAQ